MNELARNLWFRVMSVNLSFNCRQIHRKVLSPRKKSPVKWITVLRLVLRGLRLSVQLHIDNVLGSSDAVSYE